MITSKAFIDIFRIKLMKNKRQSGLVKIFLEKHSFKENIGEDYIFLFFIISSYVFLEDLGS